MSNLKKRSLKAISPLPKSVRSFVIRTFNMMRDEKRQFVYILLVIIVYTFTSDFIWGVFDKYIVDLLLSKFNEQPLTITEITIYLMTLLGFGLWIIRRSWKTSYQDSFLHLFLLASFVFLYYCERKYFNYYWHAPLYDKQIFGKSFAKLDPLYIVAAIYVTILLINRFRRFRYKTNTGLFTQDLPITYINHDTLSRETFFNDFINHIINVGFNGNRGFAIGIVSSWGNGKTSLLRILIRKLRKVEDIITIEYNPWLSMGTYNLTNDFFQSLESELSEYIDTRNFIEKYGSELVKIDTELNPIQKFSQFFSQDKTLEERFEGISKLINKTNRRLFVIIDDIDRLDNEEVFEVLRMIRNSANFPRIHFIVTYDKEYIRHALIQRRIYNAREYLDKIFDLEIVLPKIPIGSLQTEISSGMNRIFQKLNIENRQLQDYQNQLQNLLSEAFSNEKSKAIATAMYQVFKNKRDIIRFCNSIALVFAINYKRVYLPDLIIIEMIKLKDNKLYSTLVRNQNYLLFSTNDKGNRVFKLYSKSSQNENSDDLILNSFRQMLFDVRVDIKDKFVSELIAALFMAPQESDFNSRLSIHFIDNFDGYFIYEDTGVSFNDIDDILNS